MSSSVHVILVNFSRPQNMPQVIEAWRGQTVPPGRITVVDNSPTVVTPEVYPSVAYGAHDVWRMRENHGCSCRLYPALADLTAKYIVFADDDHLPGVQALKHLLEEAERLRFKFATLGEIGRNFRLDRPVGHRYVYGNTVRNQTCDLTCRCYMVERRFLHQAVVFREEMLNKHFAVGTLQAVDPKLLQIHDDMLICLSVQKWLGVPSRTTQHAGEDSSLFAQNLRQDGPEAVYRRPTHLAERCAMVDLALECGWGSKR